MISKHECRNCYYHDNVTLACFCRESPYYPAYTGLSECCKMWKMCKEDTDNDK